MEAENILSIKKPPAVKAGGFPLYRDYRTKLV